MIGEEAIRFQTKIFCSVEVKMGNLWCSLLPAAVGFLYGRIVNLKIIWETVIYGLCDKISEFPVPRL